MEKKGAGSCFPQYFVSALNDEQSPSMTLTKSPLHLSDCGESSGDTTCILKQRKKESKVNKSRLLLRVFHHYKWNFIITNDYQLLIRTEGEIREIPVLVYSPFKRPLKIKRKWL